MPHAKQGGKGVWALAVVGSKFEGTGLEKLHIVQTQVAVLTAGGLEKEVSEALGELFPFREGDAAFDTARV